MLHIHQILGNPLDFPKEFGGMHTPSPGPPHDLVNLINTIASPK